MSEQPQRGATLRFQVAGYQFVPEIGPDLEPPADWTEEALCAQVDPELFFPEQGAHNRAAKAICAECPCNQTCLDYALNFPTNLAGIWGGTTEKERAHVRYARRTA